MPDEHVIVSYPHGSGSFKIKSSQGV